MTKELTIGLLNMANKENLLHMLFGRLISSDTLTNADDCKNSIDLLEKFKEAIPDTEIEDKDKWLSFIDDGLEIVRSDLENFEK